MTDNEFTIKQGLGFIVAQDLFKRKNKYDAIKLGLVNTKGDILRLPETDEEVKALNSLDLLMIKISALLGSKLNELYSIKYSNYYRDSMVWNKINSQDSLKDVNIISKINKDIQSILWDADNVESKTD